MKRSLFVTVALLLLFGGVSPVLGNTYEYNFSYNYFKYQIDDYHHPPNVTSIYDPPQYDLDSRNQLNPEAGDVILWTLSSSLRGDSGISTSDIGVVFEGEGLNYETISPYRNLFHSEVIRPVEEQSGDQHLFDYYTGPSAPFPGWEINGNNATYTELVEGDYFLEQIYDYDTGVLKSYNLTDLGGSQQIELSFHQLEVKFSLQHSPFYWFISIVASVILVAVVYYLNRRFDLVENFLDDPISENHPINLWIAAIFGFNQKSLHELMTKSWMTTYAFGMVILAGLLEFFTGIKGPAIRYTYTATGTDTRFLNMIILPLVIPIFLTAVMDWLNKDREYTIDSFMGYRLWGVAYTWTVVTVLLNLLSNPVIDLFIDGLALWAFVGLICLGFAENTQPKSLLKQLGYLILAFLILFGIPVVFFFIFIR